MPETLICNICNSDYSEALKPPDRKFTLQMLKNSKDGGLAGIPCPNIHCQGKLIYKEK